MIRDIVEAHHQASQAWEKKAKKDRKRDVKGKGRASKPADAADDPNADSDDASDASDDDGDDIAMTSAKADAGIRKIRIGTFEDSGKCKGWAFIDFHTAQQATAALINGRNHSLNGRALTLEYASAEAVRRGGGRMDGQASVSAPKRDKTDKRPHGDRAGARAQAQAGEADGKGAEAEEQASKQAFYRPPLETNPYAASEASRAAAAIIQAGGKVHKPNKAERKALRDQKAKEDRGNSKKRVKPGAALADAKREKVAILPAAGTKVVFD